MMRSTPCMNVRYTGMDAKRCFRLRQQKKNKIVENLVLIMMDLKLLELSIFISCIGIVTKWDAAITLCSSNIFMICSTVVNEDQLRATNYKTTFEKNAFLNFCVIINLLF